MMKLGVYGHGQQSKRYLDPKNWPDGVEVVQLEREDWKASVSGFIVANAPEHHPKAIFQSLAAGRAVLCEKPICLYPLDRLIWAHAGKQPSLLVAHTHLWSVDFLRLPKSPSATVQWRGPEREDGSCPAMLDWGPHAWSMALALGTERVSTGAGDRRYNWVRSGDSVYVPAQSRDEVSPTPMHEMLLTFASLIDGGYDWRAEPDFALEVHRRCFKP